MYISSVFEIRKFYFGGGGGVQHAAFRKCNLFTSRDAWVSGNCSSLASANLSHWIVKKLRLELLLTEPTEVSPPPSPEDGKSSNFRNAVFFTIPRDGPEALQSQALYTIARIHVNWNIPFKENCFRLTICACYSWEIALNVGFVIRQHLGPENNKRKI
jgi:hypothetical protein